MAVLASRSALAVDLAEGATPGVALLDRSSGSDLSANERAQEDDEEQPSGRAPVARPTPRQAARAQSLGGDQIPISIALGLLTSLGAAVAGGSDSGKVNLWVVGGVLAGGAVATGLITCALGQSRTGRRGGCGPSVAGALIGIVAALPGLVMLKGSQASCNETGSNADDKCAIAGTTAGFMGLVLGVGGYALGTTFGSRVGWQQGASPARGATMAGNINLLSVQF